MSKPQDSISCDQCGSQFRKRADKIKLHKNHFCSNACKSDFKKTSVSVNCELCGKAITINTFRIGRASKNYCSVECFNTGRVTKTTVACSHCGEPVERHLSELSRHPVSYCSVKCFRDSVIPVEKPEWAIKQAPRKTLEYKDWRFEVMQERSFCCEKCNTPSSKLNVHHIKSFVGHPELQMDKSNVSLLCEDCHKEFHSIFGKHSFTDTDFYTWMSEKGGAECHDQLTSLAVV